MSREEEAGGSPGQLSLGSFSSLFSISSTTSTPTAHLPPLPSLSLSIGGDEQPPLSSCSAADPAGEDDEEDERAVRMMKNRESALRSRARKRAYVQELEKEVGRLVDQNLKLKRQCKQISGQLKTEMAALVQVQQQPSKSPQHRRTPSSSTHL